MFQDFRLNRDGSVVERHPNDHNTRKHFHPPPDAHTPGEDDTHPDTYPDNWRDLLAIVLPRLDDRIEAFWDQ